MKKEFERPELIIIYFEDELATNSVSSGDPIDPDNDENGSGYDYPPHNP